MSHRDRPKRPTLPQGAVRHNNRQLVA